MVKMNISINGNVVMYVFTCPLWGHSMLRDAVGSGGLRIPGKKRYEGLKFNVISVYTRGWVGVKFTEKSVI